MVMGIDAKNMMLCVGVWLLMDETSQSAVKEHG